jgi:glucosamine-6-phosphate deaminase
MEIIMKIIIVKDYNEMSERAVELVADEVKRNPEALLSFPGGETPLGLFERFTERVNENRLDISRAKYVSLDEWVGLSDQDEGSCGLFNNENLLSKIKVPFSEVKIINGIAKDIEQEREDLNQFILKHGPLGVSVLGIGMNGHLGFNEVGASFDSLAHITPLDEVTKKVMVKYFGTKFSPSYGITQGIGQIMAAGQVILLANGKQKAEIIYEALKGPVTNMVPASILQKHSNCYCVLDEAAASKLMANGDYERKI